MLKYLSYSQYDSYNNGTYWERYILLKEDIKSDYIDLGKSVAERLEAGEDFGLPTPTEREKKLVTKVGDITLLGYLDGFSEKEMIIDEYKTATRKWTKGRVDRHEQLDFYAIMVSQNYKVPIEDIKIRLHWLETYRDIDGVLKLSGHTETTETKRTKENFNLILPKIQKAWEGINNLLYGKN